jgi:hypothetical protein
MNFVQPNSAVRIKKDKRIWLNSNEGFVGFEVEIEGRITSTGTTFSVYKELKFEPGICNLTPDGGKNTYNFWVPGKNLQR